MKQKHDENVLGISLAKNDRCKSMMQNNICNTEYMKKTLAGVQDRLILIAVNFPLWMTISNKRLFLSLSSSQFWEHAQ